MKTKNQKKVSPSVAFAEDDLLQLEIRIAQRADQITRDKGDARGNNLEHWLQAEREILAKTQRQGRSARPLTAA